MKRRPRSALARVLGCLIVTDFLAMGFTAAKILGISWWWGFGLEVDHVRAVPGVSVRASGWAIA